MRIGIIKEEKVPVDHRVPLTPKQCKSIIEKYPGVEIYIEPSPIRCFKDEEYIAEGIALSDDLSSCDILMGVKEVPIDKLIPNKTYLFFSHTIKKQTYNRKLLQSILAKNIRLIDYECLKNHIGQRVVAFGRWAGIVGAYNALRTYGLKYSSFELKPAHECFDMDEVRSELTKVKLGPIRILLTGGGRVARGAQEILDFVEIRNVEREGYLNQVWNEPVYIQLDSDAYNEHKDGKPFDFNEFYNSPERFKSTFAQYTGHTDLLIAGAYWDPKAPKLFSREDIAHNDFKIKIVADITCDIEGSIPTTLRATTIADPFYDIRRRDCSEQEAFSDQDNITVMAIDNLPCELPRDSSQAFGEMLIDHVMEQLLIEDRGMISKATIADKGGLTEHFQYLSDYIK